MYIRVVLIFDFGILELIKVRFNNSFTLKFLDLVFTFNRLIYYATPYKKYIILSYTSRNIVY